VRRTNNLFPLLLSYGIFTTFLSFYGVFVTYWLEEGFQETSYLLITVIAGVPTLGTMIGINIWGIVADHFQKRRALISMAAIAAALQFLLLSRVVTNVIAFLLIVSVFPLFYSAMQTAAPTLATLLHTEKGKASGLFVMAGSTGWFFGGILGGVLYPRMGMRWLLTGGAILCVLAGGIVLFSEDPKDPSRSKSSGQNPISWIQLFKTPQIMIVVVTTFLLQLGNNIFFGLSTNYFIRVVGMTTFQVGLGVSGASLIGTILSKPLGNHIEHHGRRNIFLIGIISYPIGLLAMFFGRNPWIVTLIWCFPFYIWMWTSGVAIMADLTRPSERAKAVGMFFASFFLAQTIGTVLGGAVADSLGLRSLILLPIPAGIGAFLFAYFFLKESLQNRELSRVILIKQ